MPISKYKKIKKKAKKATKRKYTNPPNPPKDVPQDVIRRADWQAGNDYKGF